MKPVFFVDQARHDLSEIISFIAQDSPEAAARTEVLLRERATRRGHFPAMGIAQGIQGNRLLPVARTPYILVYRDEPDRITILRIWHGARGWPPVS